jgi:DNA-binding MarR family transcriptional regulator
VDITTVSAVFSLMARVLGALSEHEVFKEAELGLAEWSILRALAAHPEWRSGRIAAYLGVTPQRTAQLIASLSKAQFITVAASESDARKKDVALTAKGKTTLDLLDKQVLELVAAAFEDRPGAIAQTRRNLQRLFAAARGSEQPKGLSISRVAANAAMPTAR